MAMQTGWDVWQTLPFQTQKYYLKKGAVNNSEGELRGMSVDELMRRVNVVNQIKGGQQVYDPSQIASASQPLIAQRNKRGLGGIFGALLPIAGTLIAPGIGTALGSALGVGATAGSILAGAGIGGITAGLTGGDPLKGALLGGAGSALSGGLGNVAKVGKVGGGSAGSGILGAMTRSGGTLADIGYGINSAINTGTGIGRTISGAVGLPGPKSAVWGGATAAPVGASAPMGGSITMGNPLATALSGYQQYQTQDKIEEQLRRAQQQGLSAINPYMATGYQANRQLAEALAAGFNPGDLENDPGYQFRRQQGQRQLEQSLAARGLGQSGAALKAAEEYGQNFAAQEYADAYNRWLQNNQQLAGQSGQGLGAAGAAADMYGNIGNIAANATAGKNNALTGTLASILSGRGIIGFDAMGNPIYG